MANPEKATYDDVSDDNYIDPFDEEDDDNERGPIVIVIALITLAALLAVLYVGVEFGRREGAGGGPQIIRAETTPAKSVPENRGGIEIPHTDKTVFDAISGKQAEEPEELLPPPEEPMVRPETAAVPEGAAPAGEEAPSQTPEEVAPTDIDVATAQEALTDLIEQQAANNAEPAPEAAASAQTALSPPPAEPVAEVPSASTAPTAEAAPTEETPQAAEPALEFEAVPEAQETLTARVQQPSAVIQDPHFVQVTSVRTRDDAMVAWRGLEGRFGPLVSQFEPDIQTVDLGDRGIYHRVRVGPLEGRGEAQNLCSQFKQQGQDCIIVK